MDQVNLYTVLDQMRNSNNREINEFIGAAIYNVHDTKSQNLQDVWALYVSGMKHGGKFIEFGAADGINGSNTYMLEKKFGWTGVISEPLPFQHQSLVDNRSCAITTDCVWTESKKTLDFKVTKGEPDLSTIAGYGNDEHAEKRLNSDTIQVNTISLADLISSYFHYTEIDYMSVDTEGSELDILDAYFKNPISLRYKIKAISVEHNFDPNKRTGLFNLLTSRGYAVQFTDVSRWDDFYRLTT